MKLPKIEFSSHALARMKERAITQKLVKEAIKNPDRIERSSVHPVRFLIKKLYFNQKLQTEHLLMIISEVKPNLIKVITIIDTSKISKYF